MSELAYLSAVEAADAVRRKEISARELTEAALARIDEVNPRINAIVGVRREAALREAARADEAAEPSGPLHGVPVSVKESFHLEGAPVTWGNPAFTGYVSGWDATAVARLKRAGAIIVGQSNPHFMLADFAQTANDVYGVTRNPWDPARSPGGSSGGSAAALAAGLTYLDYGTDLAGSIRIPASFCGVYGLRPTAGLVPVTGMQPPGPPADPDEMGSRSAVGPLARSAADLRVALRVTAGPQEAALSWRLPPPRHERLREFRVGVVLDHPAAPVSSDVGAVLADAVDSLARHGVRIVRGWPEGIDPAVSAGTFGYHVEAFVAYQAPDGTGPDPAAFFEMEKRRMAYRAAWARYFQEVDVWLCPVNFTAAIMPDDRPMQERVVDTSQGPQPYLAQGFWISHAGLAGLPALSAPAGLTSSGLPVGLQVVGPRYEDDCVLTFAELLAGEVGGFRAPPAPDSQHR